MTSRGYTLIEILVVLLVIGLFMSFSFARFRDFQRRQLIASVSRQVLGDMRDAQSAANVGTKPTGCTGDLLSYQFEVTASSPAAYNINALCNSGTIRTKQVNQPDISISPAQSVNFLTLSEGATFNGASPKKFTITHTATSGSITIAITNTGQIYEE